MKSYVECLIETSQGKVSRAKSLQRKECYENIGYNPPKTMSMKEIRGIMA